MSFEMDSFSSEKGAVDVKEQEFLLDAFGSVFSLEDISSAYREANGDVNITGDILFTRQGTKTCAKMEEFESSIAPFQEFPKLQAQSLTVSELSCEVFQRSDHGKPLSIMKGKKMSASTGLIPVGKEYGRPEQPPNRSVESRKPMKIDLTNFSVAEILNNNEPMLDRDNKMQREVEDFLFQMLGHGFQLDMKVIREVLGHCGFDAKKGMEKLLDLSASTLEKSDDISASTLDGTRSEAANISEASIRNSNLSSVENDVLQALFTAPGFDEQKPEYCPLSKRRGRSRSFLFSNPVVARPEIEDTFRRTVTMESKVGIKDNEDSEDSFEVLRQAVKEYWGTMKEYYGAAVEAFTDGDLVRANKLLEKGHFFNKRAKMADAKSAEMLVKASDADMSLDLRDYKPSEAVRLMRSHLTTVSGITSIEYLKLRTGTEAEDKKGARKRRILRELVAESINWAEEQNGEILSIRVDELDPKKFSFVKAK